jgi:hypothetical protein
LGEARIRDLNDEINKLMRIKGHWERQIKALGGVDHHRGGVDVVDADGRTLPGGGGYKYFGAAKDLPGVKELFDAPVPTEPPKQTRAEIASRLRPDYFGFQVRQCSPMNCLISSSCLILEYVNAGRGRWRAIGRGGGRGGGCAG